MAGGGIIALSYEAKAAGVQRACVEKRRRKNAQISLVPVRVANEKADLTRYRQAGSGVFAACAKFGTIERTSIDEAYLDLTQAASETMKKYEAERCLEMAAASKTYVMSDEGLEGEEDAILAAGALVCADLRQNVKEKTGFTL